MQNYLVFFISVIFILFAVVSCSYLNDKFNLQDDNPIEELVESFIEEKLDVDIDLTP